jgi:hypothetical protein
MNRFAPGKLVAVALDSINPIRSRYCQGFFLAVKIYIDVDHNGQKIFKNIKYFSGSGLIYYIITTLLLQLSGAKSPARFCKYFTTIFYEQEK